MGAYTNILIEDEGCVRLITINRENQLNALNGQTIRELGQAVNELQHDMSVRVVILTGAGSKAFVAGADIKEFADYGPQEGEQLARDGQYQVFDAIHHSTKPFIAAVNGFALGGGLELAMACQIRIAAETAKLGLPEVTLGLIPGYGGTQRLTQLVGRGRAMEMILTGGMVQAEEAHAFGLVNQVVPANELLEKARGLATKIAKQSGTAIQAAIQAVNASLDPAQNGFEQEIKSFGSCFGTADFHEGVSAFLEKRKPNF